MGSEIGISQRSSTVLHGTSAGDYFGYSVASAGDVNGDGFGDLVVGAHNSDPQGRDTAGTASIFLGSLQGISVTPTRVLAGAEPHDLFGCSVASAGDVNLDGYGDLVIGAFDSGRTTSSKTGSASVFHGSVAGIGVSPAAVLFGSSSRARFGWSVASAGDVNGDGFSDVVVGAYLARSRAGANTGTATVYRGSPDGILADRSQLLSGSAPGDRFGLSVASAGDLNGDGLSDVVVGAYEADPGGREDAGTASVFYGRTGDLFTQPAVVLEGLASQDRFGYSVSSAGDANADGFDDLLVGAFLEDSAGRFNAGAARVFFGGSAGVSTTASRVMNGASANDQFGGSVAGAGDVNRDGFSDIIVGAVFGDPIERVDTGTASIFHGSPTGTSSLAATVLGGSTDHALYGISVATYGPDSAISSTSRLALVHSAGALSDRENRTVGLTSVVASKYF